MDGAKDGTDGVKQTFLEHIQTLIGKDELYRFGWIAVIIIILLIIVVCVGCRACCCRACCFARETRTQLYMCKVPKSSRPFCKTKVQHHQPVASPCHHPHHCTTAVELDHCACNHCLHCAVQPQSKAKVDKATSTAPTRIGFESVHSEAAPAGWQRPNPPSVRRVCNTVRTSPIPKRRAPEPPGFKYPPGAFSYHKPKPPTPTAPMADEAAVTAKPSSSYIVNSLNNNKPSNSDEEWE